MNRKIVLAAILILSLVIVSQLYLKNTGNKSFQMKSTQPDSQDAEDNNSSNQTVKIISTKPDPLEEAIISSTEVLEIIFNRPLENEGELKIRFDPKIEFEIKLSQDRKTGKIIPKKPYELGATYTLFIGPDTKFDGVGEWKQEKIFHFKTVRYRGV